MPKAVKDSRFKFSKTSRLINQKDFQSVFAHPSKVARKYLLALIQPNHTTKARLGLIVAKARLPLAVDRNYLRRLIRESFRHHQDELKGLDIVVLLRSKCTPRDGKAWRDEIEHLWQQIKLSKKP